MTSSLQCEYDYLLRLKMTRCDIINVSLKPRLSAARLRQHVKIVPTYKFNTIIEKKQT